MSTLSIPVKALFIDAPFMEEDTSRAQRSRHIWSVLAGHTDADLLLLKSDKYREQPVPRHHGYDRLYSLSLDENHQLLPTAYHQLAKGQVQRLAGILDGKRYQLIVMAGLECLPLVYSARKTLPHSVIVLDVDRLFVPEIQQQWKSHQDLNNLPKLWDLLRHKALDKFLLRYQLKFLLADPEYALLLKPKAPLPETDYLHLPLPYAELEKTPDPVPAMLPAAKYILFWGDDSLPVNLEAAKTIAGDIYPRISRKLVEKDISIVLCGGEAYQNYCGGRIIHAPAADLDALLGSALFVLLPITKADCESRIYKCAQHHRAVLCTTDALKSLPMPEGTYYPGNDPDSMAQIIHHLLRAPKELEKTGQNLHDYCHHALNADTLGSGLVEILNQWMASDANE